MPRERTTSSSHHCLYLPSPLALSLFRPVSYVPRPSRLHRQHPFHRGPPPNSTPLHPRRPPWQQRSRARGRMHYPRGINRPSRSRESRGGEARKTQGIEGRGERVRASKRARGGGGPRWRGKAGGGKGWWMAAGVTRGGLPEGLLTIIRRAYVGKQRHELAARWKCIM